ncbi:DNA topoisomerase [Anaerocolumna cellulosilytica]|uniref:DNA topoisomerase n=1 Tax=Anaerocolumna cellulosilytica TaxID=433286 RepID=A0A6S6QVF2_9FIRM|nr:DNA topoisomerase [Anaerocolumna cellulosilytica]MBB5196051.1 DNA topoisomerase-3 [Anaerocolumna cellulosilytica]BCJ93646.1 DNA topoisomerase [Anaerocolumna cellulosilytica]
MSKSLYISEKPSVAQEFAKALKENFKKHDGYMESDSAIVTWCVGHLVTMSYPESYDPALKRWSLETIPFLPKEFRYEIIPNVKKQFQTVKDLLNRKDVSCIYVCTDSGREGEYIYRLVDQLAKVPAGKEKRRVWIDSQTEEEILRGIKEAKDLSAYDNLSDAAYLRAKEDYLMGINFSRVLTLKYGQNVTNYLGSQKRSAISVGRVMTCVLGMVVRREREIREFVKTPFYRVLNTLDASGRSFEGEFRAVEGSKYFNSLLLYKENGFKEQKDAKNLIGELLDREPNLLEKQENSKNSYVDTISDEENQEAEITNLEKKKENKNPPLLFNLAELQNECSRLFKISPDETLKITQELYEKKLVTYPRTDARVLSTAVSKEIHKNIGGLKGYVHSREYALEILTKGSYKNIAKTRYVNDKQITDHYAIIPTGQGLNSLNSLSATAAKVYEVIVRRFLCIFYPPAVYQKINLTTRMKTESFFSSFKVLLDEGYLRVAINSFDKRQEKAGQVNKENPSIEAGNTSEKENSGEESFDTDFMDIIKGLKKGMQLPVKAMTIKEGETAPPKRYSSGSMILAMENAGQLIEDEELRAQIKGSGIGTSATRAEILNKLVKIEYLALNKKTQIVTPTLFGEMIYDVVNSSIRSLLNPELTASWEKGLTMVSDGSITKEEYMEKLEGFVSRLTNGVKGLNNQYVLNACFKEISANYKK